jgi:thiol peroxidase
MHERTGEAFEAGMQLTVVGERLRPGQPAPDFFLEYLNPADSALSTVRLADTTGKVRLLNVINSIDTPVCHIETCKWEKLRDEVPDDVVVYTISMDLPFAQARWHTAEGVQHRSLSAHQSKSFGRDYGVLIKEWRLLQRAVFVIDRQGRIAHAEYVADQMREPDYAAALQALRQAAR